MTFTSVTSVPPVARVVEDMRRTLREIRDVHKLDSN
jgi:hypothetical protein